MKKLIKILIRLALICIVLVLVVNAYVIKTTKSKMITDGNYSSINDADCIIILGAGI